MRARQRFLNARTVGSSLVLDSRFIQGISNGSLISSWDDISGNSRNATQANSLLQPTYEVSVQGGQPGVRFNNSTLAGSLSALGTSSYTFLLVCRASNTSGFRTPLQIGDTTSSGSGLLLATDGQNNDGTWVFGRIGGIFLNLTLPAIASQYSILRSVYNSSTTSFVPIVNGSATTPSSASSGFPNITTNYRLGNYTGTGQAWIGDIMLVTIVPVNLSTSICRRLEHAAAFSFKIACN